MFPSKRQTCWTAIVLLLIAVGAGWFVFRPGLASGIPQVDWAGVPEPVVRRFETLCEDLGKEPGSAERWGELGMFLMAHQYRADARGCFAKAEQLDASDFRWPYLTAILLEETDLPAAVAYYEVAMQRQPDHVPGRLRYAAVLQRLNESDRAREQLAIARRLAPNDDQPLLGMARLALAAGELVEARGSLEEASRRAPWSREVHLELARVYLMLKEPQLAQRAKQEAVRWPPANVSQEELLVAVEKMEAVARSETYYADELASRGEHASAETQFRRLVELRPELTRTRLNLGQSLVAQRRIGEAIAVYRDMIEEFPEIPEAHYSLGLALEAVNDMESAKQSYRAAIERKPDYMEPYFALGLLCERQGELSAAIEAYRRAVAAGPSFAPARLALGSALAAANRPQEAVHHVRIAVQLAPGDPVPRQILEQMTKERAP